MQKMLQNRLDQIIADNYLNAVLEKKQFCFYKVKKWSFVWETPF